MLRNRIIFFIIVLCTLALCQPSSASSELCWIFGNVATVPEQTQYNNMTCWSFNFTVSSSNATLIPTQVTVYAPLTLMVNVVFSQGQNLNITGTIDEKGNFVAAGINVPSMQWIETLKALWNTISSIGRTLVTLIVQIVEAFTHVQLPTWTVSLILVGLLTFLVLKFLAKLPLIITVIMFFVVVALISDLITTLQLQI